MLPKWAVIKSGWRFDEHAHQRFLVMEHHEHGDGSEINLMAGVYIDGP
jgi:hypothetical protein